MRQRKCLTLLNITFNPLVKVKQLSALKCRHVMFALSSMLNGQVNTLYTVQY